MQSTLTDILESLKTRTYSGDRWGIGTAAQYVGAVAPLLGIDPSSAGLTPAKAFGLSNATAEAWQKELAAAASRLTYCDEQMADTDLMVKSLKDDATITKGAVLEYDCVLSSRRKDRDGDILEPKGLEVDTKMPLLWQHIQISPIGKHVNVIDQGENSLKCKFAIADTPLGRDAATLVRFGALRKSHGFKPIEFEPVEIVKTADGKQMVRGWHVKRASVLEGSLVSIPANADGNVFAVYEKEFDGICTAFGRSLLQTEVVKHWAKSFHDRRPVVVRGASLPLPPGESAQQGSAGRYVFNELAERWQDTITNKFVSAAEVGIGNGIRSKQVELNQATGTGTAASGQGQSETTEVTTTKDTMTTTPLPQAETADKTGKCPCGGDYDSTGSCPSCGHIREPAKAGKSAGDVGKTAPVSLSAGVSSLGEMVAKAGRVLSATNAAKLKAAMDAIKEVLEAAGEVGDSDDAKSNDASGKNVVTLMAQRSAGPAGVSLMQKAVTDLNQKMYGMDPYLDNSWEATQYQLSKTAGDFLKLKGYEADRWDVSLLATFAGKAIVGVRLWDDKKKSCYELDWSRTKDGAPEWNGEPKEVAIKAQVIEKFLAGVVAKSPAGGLGGESGDGSGFVTTPTVDPLPSLSDLTKQLTARILTSDGPGGMAKQSRDKINQAYETLEKSYQAAEFAEILR